MKKLIIVRHAKSSWEHDVSDQDRALIPEGIVRAQKHAKILREKLKTIPDSWVTSYANRALHTSVIFAREFNQLKQLKIEKNLYTFSMMDLLEEIKNLPENSDEVILFGHNDACYQTIVHLTDEYIPGFKTASVACITFNQNNWSDIEKGKLEFIISKGEIH